MVPAGPIAGEGHGTASYRPDLQQASRPLTALRGGSDGNIERRAAALTRPKPLYPDSSIPSDDHGRRRCVSSATPVRRTRSIHKLCQISNPHEFAIIRGIVFRGDDDVPAIHLEHSYIVHQSLERTIGCRERAALQVRPGYAFVRSSREQKRDSARTIAFCKVTLDMAKQIGRQQSTHEV
jgi:hypothetical protein